jgi:RNA polymerase sigma-70 factor (ECF subfamily)
VLPSEETALIGEAQRGSAAAYEELVRRWDRSVLRLALNLTRSEEQARDIYQESFLRIFRALPGFRFECSFQTWVYRIVTNVCLDHLRRAARTPSDPNAVGNVALEDEERIRPIADDRPDHDPERMLARGEMRRRIDRALGSLGPRERLVFELRHYQGMRMAAIGEVLETTEGTVRNCLFRAHRSLRAALSDLRGVTGRLPHGSVGPAQADTF